VRATLLLGLVLCVAAAACDAPRAPEAASSLEAPAGSTAEGVATASANPVGEAAQAVLRGEPEAVPEPEPEPEPAPIPERIAVKEPPPEVVERAPSPVPVHEPIDFEGVPAGVEYGTGPGNGVPGGVAGGVVGPSAPQRAPDPSDKSAPASLAGSSSWNCAFPPEADAEGVDQASVTLQVSVNAEGKATAATILSDPGHGFGRAARQCALTRSYKPALDAEGKPAAGKTPPIRVRFSR
jgi:protein TonB